MEDRTEFRVRKKCRDCDGFGGELSPRWNDILDMADDQEPGYKARFLLDYPLWTSAVDIDNEDQIFTLNFIRPDSVPNLYQNCPVCKGEGYIYGWATLCGKVNMVAKLNVPSGEIIAYE